MTESCCALFKCKKKEFHFYKITAQRFDALK